MTLKQTVCFDALVLIVMSAFLSIGADFVNKDKVWIPSHSVVLVDCDKKIGRVQKFISDYMR